MIAMRFIIFFLLSLSLGATIMAFEVHENGTITIDQITYPAVGFGTYPFQGQTCFLAVTEAAKLGYRLIDTATYYENFEPIAKALKNFGRENFYVISKAWPDSHHAKGLFADIKSTLSQLQTTYLDAYLLHWPNSACPIEETLHAMRELCEKGLIRHIGLSNVTTNHLKRALECAVSISWVQVEMHPYFCDMELLEFCKKNSITVQAWRPLDLGRISTDEVLTKIGQKYGKTACQVALRWILQHGCIPIPGSTNPVHMKENLDSASFILSTEDMQKIDSKAKNGQRFRLKLEHGLGFTDEFDFSYEQCWPKKL